MNHRHDAGAAFSSFYAPSSACPGTKVEPGLNTALLAVSRITSDPAGRWCIQNFSISFLQSLS